MSGIQFFVLLALSFGSQTSVAEPAQTARTSPVSSTCLEAYSKIFNREKIKVRVVYGYKDTRPARFVGDRHERLAFAGELLKACTGGNQACGFSRSPLNADLFTKRVVGPLDNPVDVEVYLVHSSVGSDDFSNRRDLFQSWQSRYAEKAFYEGLKAAHVVYYNGHSRFGGGPDFQPPKLSSSNEPDVQHYQSLRPGFQKILEILAQRGESSPGNFSPDKGELFVLGLYSCTSSQHFAKAINEHKGLALIGTDELLHYSDAQKRSLQSLSDLLNLECSPRGIDLSQLLNRG